MSSFAAALNHTRLSTCTRHEFDRVPDDERTEHGAYRCRRCRGTISARARDAFLRGVEIGKALDPDAPRDDDALVLRHLGLNPSSALAQMLRKGIAAGVAGAPRARHGR